MQAEYPPLRPGGFIISPENPQCIPKAKPSSPPRRKKAIKIKELIFPVLDDYCTYAENRTRFIVSKLLSVLIALCCGIIFFKYFTFGTAIYHSGVKIATAASDKSFYNAFAAADTIAEQNSVYDFKPDCTLTPTLTLRSRVQSTQSVRDELLLCSAQFVRGCVLYCENTPVFSAESREIAEAVVADYIKAYSMDGDTTTSSNISYRECVISKDEISDKEQCASLLLEKDAITVTSVVNSALEKEIPFETKTQSDTNLYIGESVTVTEGAYGKVAITEETVYQNGAQKSSRILTENVIAQPVARVVRVGTKEKEVLKTGVFYPLEGVISSPFGSRWGRMHEGLDIAVAEGTAVLAAECGTVSYVSENAGGYGKFIRIDHGYGVQTAYAHLSKIEVSVGQSVNANTRIALSGNTGRSTGPHLHFEITQEGEPLDPTLYLKKR